tara:strand:+ start:156916 stop:157149 length:234 start_codon:yes stop_codon:yes gene_type:complete
MKIINLETKEIKKVPKNDMQILFYSFLTLKRELNKMHNTNEAKLTIKTFFKIKRKLAKLKTSKTKKTVWCTSINNAK